LVDHVPQGHWKTITFVAAQHALFSHPASPPRATSARWMFHSAPPRPAIRLCCREGCR
jgi:hypothetical protein